MKMDEKSGEKSKLFTKYLLFLYSEDSLIDALSYRKVSTNMQIIHNTEKYW
jgi:hypothetical protein